MSTCVALLERVSLVEALADPDLGAVLEGLDIRPFTPESVETYKKRIAKEANRFLWFHHLVEVIRISIPSCLFLLGVFLPKGLLGEIQLWVAVLIFTGLGPIRLKRRGSWKIAPLKGYAKFVPSFASFHVIEIKANLPDAEFFIHEFIQNRRTLDPFLSVRRKKGEEHFIDVWDEPNFYAEQMI